MSIPKNTAKTNTETAHNTAETAANTIFIAAADAQINGAIARGVFWIMVQITDENVDIKTVVQHYMDLGYSVKFSGVNSGNPASLFGENWVAYWDGNGIPAEIPLPAKVKISWS